jgi:ribulose 1,5-bisphosphate synthetase/thiazole synthase
MKSKIFLSALIISAIALGADYKVIGEADIVVAGGSSAGVEAAITASQKGAKVHIVSPRPYFGEDIAGTYSLNYTVKYKRQHSLSKALLLAKGNPAAMVAPITPLRIKQIFDEFILENKIAYHTWTQPVSIARDKDGKVAGIWTMSRSGLGLVKAKIVIDATERATIARSAGCEFLPFPSGDMEFMRRVIADESAQFPSDVKKFEFPGSATIDVRAGFKQAPRMKEKINAKCFSLKMKLPMKDASARSFAAAEQIARDKTWVESQIDAADIVTYLPQDRLVKSVEGVYVVGPISCADESEAKKLYSSLEENFLHANTTAQKAVESLKALKSPSEVAPLSEDIPVIAECDVFVAGAGTGGAPAAISAARAGMNVIVAEYLNMMGGLMTEGRIGQYWFGYRGGFTKEIDTSVKEFGYNFSASKAEWFRSECRKAGAEVWFRTMVVDVVKDGKKVVGVVVVMPDGTRGKVIAKAVIDATGNADLAACAGEKTEFITADELSLQGAGSTPKVLGRNYQNTDYAFVDDTDAEDLMYFSLRARLNMGDYAWDQSQIINSRERRRMRGAFYVNVQDATLGRTYPDIISITESNFDTHGQTRDLQFFVEDPGRQRRRVYLPYRAILPRETEGLLVIGLGMSAHRDAMPILRMQPDVQNQGYVAGCAASMSVKSGKELRNIDIKKLQKHLVEVGVIPPECMEMKDNFPLSDKELEAAAKSLKDQYKDYAKLLTDRDRSHKLVLSEYERAKKDGSFDTRVVYAHVLGLWGDACGGEDIATKIKSMEWDKGWNYRGMDQFGRSVSWVDSYLIALGKSKAKEGLDAAIEKAKTLTPKSEYSHYRAIALCFEGIGDKRAAGVLRSLLDLPGVSGHVHTIDDVTALVPGYSRFTTRNLGVGDKERSDVLRELCIVRALYRLGDSPDGIAKRTLEAYTKDPRRAYANHAKLVLEMK